MANTPDPEKIVTFFESMDFDEETKNLGADLMHVINKVLSIHCERCKAAGTDKQRWIDSQKLALATCLQMRIDLKV